MSDQRNQKLGTASRPLRFIRKNFEWRDYVELHYSPKYATNDELRINCIHPECDDRKNKLYINPDKGTFFCFKCHFGPKRGHDVFDFVAFTEGLSRWQATMKLLTEYKPTTPENFDAALRGELDEVPEQTPKFKVPYISGLPEEAVPLTSEHHPWWDYLITRGLTPREIQRVLQAHVILQEKREIRDHKGKYKGDIGHRIIWPIYGGDSKMISWMARTLNPRMDSIKYLNAPDTDLNSSLWPFVKPYGTEVVLVEGVIDALAVRRLEKVSAYATFGKAVSKKQRELLQMWGVEKVIMAWDKKDAKKETERTVKDLKDYFDVYVATQEDWPNELDCGGCLELENGVEYLSGLTTDTVQVDSLEYLNWRIE